MSIDSSTHAPDLGPRRPWRPAGWAVGLPVLALIWLVASLQVGTRLEQDLRQAARALAGEESSDDVEIAGRDATLVVEPGQPESAVSALESKLLTIPGLRRVSREIAAVSPMVPFELVIRRGTNGVLLQGGVADGQLRRVLVRDAGTHVAAEAVDEKLRVALGSPPGFAEAARYALRLVADATRGEARIVDTRIAVTATFDDRRAYDSAAADRRRPPEGFEVTVWEVLPPKSDPYRWSMSRSGSGLVLTGSVPSEAIRDAMLAEIREADPELGVVDRMETARGLRPGVDFEALFGATWQAVSRLKAARAEFDGARLELTGDAVGQERLARVRNDLKGGLPSGVALGDVALRSMPAQPFEFTARRVGGRVVLGGYVPTEADRNTTVAAVASRFPGERVVQDLAVAEGAPDGFAQARSVALSQLADLQEGDATLRDTSLKLSGRILYPQLADRMRRQTAGLMPAGWTAAVAVDSVPFEKPLDPIVCTDLLGDAVAREPVRFEAGAVQPTASSKPALDSLAAILHRCGPSRISLIHTAPPGQNPEAAQRIADERAEAIRVALERPDLAPTLIAIGRVATPPGAPERTEFVPGR